MKRNLSLFLILWLFVAGFGQASAVGQEVEQEAQTPEVQQELDDAISRVKLNADTLPDGFEVISEVRATKSQIYTVRQKIGFPLVALLNQKISYEGHQARLNYMALPAESWMDFGYSRLMKSEGQKGMVMAKDGVLIQMVTTKKELEDLLVLLLRLDRLQTHKIRFHLFPEGWILSDEKFLTREELGEREQQSGGTILLGLMQEIIVNRTAVSVVYFDCATEESADLVGQKLAGKTNMIEKRLVKGYGSIIVVVDSTNADLNRQVLRHMNW